MNLPTLYEYYTCGGITSGLSASNSYFTLNNRNISIYSGAMHYFRVPSEYWRDRLRKMRATGLNAVETYIPWNLHEPEPRVYDFGNGTSDFGNMLNLEQFLKTAQEEDLFTIIRPGPYICAEWEWGGLPSWLLRTNGIRVRTSDNIFIKFVERYFRLLLHILSVLQFTKGGSIIAFQIENEYGSLRRKDQKYLKHLKRILRRHRIVELLFTSDGPSVGTTGQMPNILSTGNFQAEPQQELEIMAGTQPGKPLMVMEYWAGWFDHWGESHNQIINTDYSYTLGTILRFPASVNLYMFHGGTSFGFMNGANYANKYCGQEGYQPDTTSYDYDAPLSENGDYTDKYYSTKRLINRYNQYRTRLPLMPGLSKRTAYKLINIHSMLPLEELLGKLPQITCRTLMPMELLPINNGAGQSYGYIIYRKVNLYIPANSLLRIMGYVSDTVVVLINGVLKSKVLESMKDLNHFGYYRLNNSYLIIDSEYLNATLDLVVENAGRVNYGSLKQLHHQYKGLWQGPVLLNCEPIGDWYIYPLEFKKQWNLELTSMAKWSDSKFFQGPALYRATLIISGKPVDTYVDMRNWIKGIIIVNGFVLSRYCKLGPQQAAYLPAPFLKTGANDILVFEHFENGDFIRFVNRPLFENIENKQEMYAKTLNIYLDD